MGILGERATTAEKAELFEVVMPLLEAMYEEFKSFSKKKPNDALAKREIRVVNRLLKQCRAVLESEASLQFLDLFDEDDLPQNSDVTVMLSQYVAAMETFKESYWRFDRGEMEWTWFIAD